MASDEHSEMEIVRKKDFEIDIYVKRAEEQLTKIKLAGKSIVLVSYMNKLVKRDGETMSNDFNNIYDQLCMPGESSGI